MLAALISLTVGPPLVFSEEFDGPLDPKKWGFETGFVRNEELQYYRPENAFVEDGMLIIEGRKEVVENAAFDPTSTDWRKSRKAATYSSASVTTKGLFTWRYGKLEVRARFQPLKGLWPAAWTKGFRGTWPACGEVDLLEYYQETLLANTCYEGPKGQVWNTGKTPIAYFLNRDPAWANKFHTWTMDWTEESIKLSVDGELLNTTDIRDVKNPDGSTPFHQPHYLILNLAIGATGGDPSELKFPTRFEIDYVRIYSSRGD